MLLGALEPLIRRCRQAVIGGVAVLVLVRRIDDTRDMTRATEHEALDGGLGQLGAVVGGLPLGDVVLACGDPVARCLDLGEIDRHAVQLDATGLHQAVLEIHVTQIPGMGTGRQVGAVGVPIQQVERGRRFALEIVGDVERPEQVILAQQIEGERHHAAIQIAVLRHLLLEALQHRLVEEDTDLTGIGEVLQRRHVADRAHAVRLLLGRQIGHGAGRQRTADAVGQDVDLLLAGGLLDGIHRGQRPHLHVIGPGEITLLGPRIAPGDQEHGVALLHQPAHHRIVLTQIENVVLVDPRRHDQQRRAEGLLGGRTILDQLDQLVLEDHVTRSDGDVVAETEGFGVGHRDIDAFGGVGQVIAQTLQAVEQVLAAGLAGHALHFRVGGGEVGGREGADVLARVELEIALLALRQALNASQHVVHGAREQQVLLHEEMVIGLTLPGLITEAAIRARGRDHRLDALAIQLAQRALQQGHLVLEEARLGRHQQLRVTCQGLGPRLEATPHLVIDGGSGSAGP